MTAPTILLSAGEASSDMYAARLATALSARTGARIFGMGGPRMAEAGVELIADYHEVAVVGIAEVPRNIPVGYFIGPQIWAWRAGRVRIVRRRVKKMVVIFPFEEPIYRQAGVPVEFVGHPLVDVVKATQSREQFAAQHGLDGAKPIV